MPDRRIVYVIDDDAALRESLSFLLEAAGFQVTACLSVDEFLQLLPAEQGCVISDVCMPGTTGLHLLRKLKEKDVRLPVIVMSGRGNIPMAVEAIRHGAVDFIEKPFSDDVILQAVISALSSAAQDTGTPEAISAQRRMSSLSVREREVLNGLLAGHPNKVIGHNLGISPRTVEIYRANLMLKMEADSLSMLLRTALLAERGRSDPAY